MNQNSNNRPGGYRGNNGGGRSDDFRRDGGDRSDGRQNGGGRSDPPPLPQDYLEALKKGYYCRDPESGKDVLRKEYIYGYPALLVKYFGQSGADKSSQVRKFYDYVVRIREKLANGASFAEVEASFCMLAPFAQNALGRHVVSKNFCRFIQKNVDAVHSKEGLTAFAMHFQAVIAYLNK